MFILTIFKETKIVISYVCIKGRLLGVETPCNGMWKSAVKKRILPVSNDPANSQLSFLAHYHRAQGEGHGQDESGIVVRVLANQIDST